MENAGNAGATSFKGMVRRRPWRAYNYGSDNEKMGAEREASMRKPACCLHRWIRFGRNREVGGAKRGGWL